jgi:hypothetical protein
MNRSGSIAALLLLSAMTAAPAAAADRFEGFNIVAVPGHSFGMASTHKSLVAAQRAGANTVAIVPFLWQRDSQHAGLVRGNGMPDGALRIGIREAHTLKLKVVIKPHVWVEGSWAGSVEPKSDADWKAWFANYRTAVLELAKVAADEHAEVLSIGTELERTSQRPEWLDVIAAVRKVYPGLLTYAAHNLEEAEAVKFWGKLDAIGVTLYPPLGADNDADGRRAVMRTAADRLDALSKREGKPVFVAEIGLRSAKGAAAKPWESPEERKAEPDPALQAQVLSDWLDALDRPSVNGVLVWRWFTDPAAGGVRDTDFTVQGKPAERVFCARAKSCPK